MANEFIARKGLISLEDSQITGSLDISGILKIPGFTNVSTSLAASVAGGDNLGNHTATQDLNMGSNDITSVGNVDGVDVSTLNTSFNTLEGKTLVSSSSQIASDISGSFTATSASLSTRTTTLEGNGVFTAAGISGSFTAPSASISTRLTTAESELGNTLFSGSAQVDHDATTNFVANEHIDHSGVSITAGAGLTGGGTIESTRDIAVGAGTGVTVNANDVAIGQDVATTANVLFNHITASGNISASGTVIANAFTGTLTGTATGLSGTPDIVVGSLTATSITSSIVTSSIIYTEGSNIFGDASDDTHKFNGSITSSGNISSSGTITANNFIGDGSSLTSLPSQTENDFTTVLKNKLDAVEASADVTDATNVTAAGALMDSELSEIATVKALTATGISGSFTAASSSFSTRVTANDSKLTANTSNVTSAGALMDSELAGIAAVKATTGTFLSADETKLDAIEASADVTDATNVTSAGALMDSELSEIATVKALTAAGISGSFTATSASFSTRVTANDAKVSYTDAAVTSVIHTANIVSSSAQIATEISGAFVAPSASFSTRVTANDAKLTANTSNVTSAGALMDSELSSIANIKALDQSVISGATPTFTTTNFTDASNKRLMTDAQETKLDAVEASADVTDATNVTSAGALMDSELSEIATVKALTAVGISGSFTAASASFSTRVTANDAKVSYTDAAVKTKLNTEAVVSGSATNIRTFLNVENGADVTDATNVTAAGALMDSELAGIAAVKATTGTFLSADETKLDGIEASADVTDATNVTAAGALMDSEVTSLALIKGLTSSQISGSFTAASASFSTRVTANDAKLTANTSNVTSAGALMDSELAGIAAVKATTGTFLSADETKLDAIEASADVTDATNVTAAGALMDSELTNLAAVKAINQGLTTTSNVQFGQVTASGAISSSGTITMLTASIGGGIFTSASLAAAIVGGGDGDITSVVAGAGMTGGATSGEATLNVIGGNGITANANDIAITAAQTTITSIYATDLKIGEDSQTAIDFETVNEIHFDANNAEVMNIKAGGADITGHITASGDISSSGTITGNSIVGTLGTAAQTNITSLGTLTALTIDQLNFNGVNINSTTDTDVFMGLNNSGFGFEANVGDKFLWNTNQNNVDFHYSGESDADLFYIDASTDNIGIGDATPTAKLDVAGNINTTSHITASGNISSSGTITAEQLTSTDDLTVADDVFLGNGSQLVWDNGGSDSMTLRGINQNIMLYSGSTSTITLNTIDGSIETDGNLIGNRRFNTSSTTNDDHHGDIVYFGGGSTTLGNLVYYKGNDTWNNSQANNELNTKGLMGIALGTTPSTDGVLLRGMYTLDHDPGTIGEPLYLSDAVAGNATGSIPTTSGNFVRIIGYCIDSTDGKIWFNPDNTWVEIA